MILPISILFTLSAILFLTQKLNSSSDKIEKAIIIVVGIILILIAGFRPSEMNDYKDYLIGYNTLTIDGFGRWEPGYWYLMYLIKSRDADFIVLLIIMAATSIGIRLYAIEKTTSLVWGSITIYISNLFILHDMIQMRCAIASGLLIIAIYYKINKKNIRCIIATIIAILFHYSSILIIPVLFLRKELTIRYIYLFLLPFSYILVSVFHFHSTTVFSKMPLVGSYIEGYSINFQQGEVNVLNALQIIRGCVCMLLWFFIKRIPYNQYFIIFLKIYTISLCCLPLFSDIYVISYRVSEFYLVSEIIVIPYFAYIFKPYVKIGKILVISIATIFLLMNIYYTKYLI